MSKAIAVGNFVAFNKLADCYWFEVLAINGFTLSLREEGTNNMVQYMDKDLVEQVRCKTKRAWKNRLAKNVEELNAKLLERFYEEEGLSDAALGNSKEAELKLIKEFLDWVGLKVTPTAIKRVKTLLIADRKAAKALGID